jgi:ethanolamine utilization microcompartment shell protein EutL
MGSKGLLMARSFEAAWADYNAAVTAHDAAVAALRQAMHATTDSIDLACITTLREAERAAAARREQCVKALGSAPIRS